MLHGVSCQPDSLRVQPKTSLSFYNFTKFGWLDVHSLGPYLVSRLAWAWLGDARNVCLVVCFSWV